MAGATSYSLFPLKGEKYLSLTKDHFYSSVVDYLAQVETEKTFPACLRVVLARLWQYGLWSFQDFCLRINIPNRNG